MRPVNHRHQMSRTIVLGIGNRLGGDDAAGIAVVDKLNQRQERSGVALSANIVAVDAGTSPESYASLVRQHRPDLLILVDAADMRLPTGSLRVITPEEISVSSFSTHSMPLSTFISYVEDLCGKVVLVGVQPGQTETGGRISKAVRASIKRLSEAILEGRVTEIPPLEEKD